MVRMKKVIAKMGKENNDKRRHDEVVNDDDEDHVLLRPVPTRFRAPMTPFSGYMQKLEHKKASVREDGLSACIRIFNEGKQYSNNLEIHFLTYLFQVLNCLKKGLTREKQLASQALGLMAITLSETENAEEIYRNTISLVTELLLVPNERLEPCRLIALVESLAMVTFFCASNSKQIQEAMQVIWEFICPKSKLRALRNQVVADTTLSTLIYAWLFLLTKLESWEITYHHWQGAISLFLTLLKEEATCVAAGEALALIFDCDSIDKFVDNKTEEFSFESYNGLRKYIKDIILKQLESTSMEAKTALPLKHMFNNAARADWDVLMYFKENKCPKYYERFDGQKLILSSWSSIIQLKFLKNFLGEEEFPNHMLQNEVIQHLFKFVPYYEEEDTPYLYEPTLKRIESRVYLHAAQEKDPKLLTKSETKKEREHMKSIIDRSKTKLLNKRRTFAKERKGNAYLDEVEP
ncbi:hypothetical protein PIB30_088011 [Stylosanthes scabra]|uniref:Interferon-related developmental regulator N-terminal domain-containing protein n=1 Tax=Stylosanthes scabra TaxID=79078 RepID=A0ABU6WTI7_9FABA|nr:hypothetical protein [Stylosanthes scabra]